RLRKELREIRASLDYLRRLADGLHLLAMGPGDGDDATVTEIARWWEDVEPLMLRGARRRGALTASIPAGLPPVGVSSHRLTQAVFNLVVNAADAIAPEGHIWLTVGLSEAGLIEICVRDDGPGMTEEVRRRALDPFFTTKKRGLGTGLGLSLVHAVARAAG